MRVLVAVAIAVAAGLTTAIFCVAVGLFYVVMQVRHLLPPITGTDAAYGIELIAYAGIGIFNCRGENSAVEFGKGTVARCRRQVLSEGECLVAYVSPDSKPATEVFKSGD